VRAPDWLTARPVAHRGLHDIARGIVENMPGAAEAAIAGNFAIECDVQLTADADNKPSQKVILANGGQLVGPRGAYEAYGDLNDLLFRIDL